MTGKGLVAFPKGFHMIAGNNERDTYTVGDVYLPDPEKSLWAALGQTSQTDLRQRAVGFNCLHYAKAPEGALFRHYMPDKKFLDENCRDGVRFELQFPSCWNGKDLDSPDHQSHMAYPDLVNGGWCPEGFPVRTASLLFETIWNTNAFRDRNGEFIASNGDKKGRCTPSSPMRPAADLLPAGFAYHGDFMMGWESEQFLQQAIDTCKSDSGLQADCPLFKIQESDESGQCKMPIPDNLVSEKVQGPGLLALPGNVGQVGQQAVPPVSPVTYSPTPPPTPPPTTPTPAVSYEAVSTQMVSVSNIVTEVVWEKAIVYVTEEIDVVTTVTVNGEPPKMKARRRMEGHVRRHGHHGHGI